MYSTSTEHSIILSKSIALYAWNFFPWMCEWQNSSGWHGIQDFSCFLDRFHRHSCCDSAQSGRDRGLLELFYDIRLRLATSTLSTVEFVKIRESKVRWNEREAGRNCGKKKIKNNEHQFRGRPINGGKWNVLFSLRFNVRPRKYTLESLTLLVYPFITATNTRQVSRFLTATTFS